MVWGPIRKVTASISVGPPPVTARSRAAATTAIMARASLPSTRTPGKPKAAAFGFPGVRVDGNDALAMISVVAAARERAVTGRGPTLIEAVTFRMGPHTTADDPKRYQRPDERAGWEGRDPILRLRRHLEGRGLWDGDRQAAAEAAAGTEVDAAWDRAEAATVSPDAFFDHVYAEPTPRMETQRAELRARLGLDPGSEG